MKTCKNKALFAYTWAGERKICCAKHADQIRVVGSIIGHTVAFEKISTDKLCPNVDEQENLNNL